MTSRERSGSDCLEVSYPSSFCELECSLCGDSSNADVACQRVQTPTMFLGFVFGVFFCAPQLLLTGTMTTTPMTVRCFFTEIR
jgi:hypothetical protein